MPRGTLRGLLALLCLCPALTAWGTTGVTPNVICQDGAKHRIALRTTAAGSPGAQPYRAMTLGPSRTVWLKLPGGSRLAASQRTPIPVTNLNAGTVEVLLAVGNRQERRRVEVRSKKADGLTRSQLIRTRTAIEHYALPEGCRVLGREEAADYAQALLNNAGCLLPAAVHERLANLPGGQGAMLRSCGWNEDVERALRSLRKAADRGSMEAGWVLSQFYLGNLGERWIDHEQAYERLSQASSVGHASADLMTGIMRWRGNGAITNAQAAFETLLPHARTGSREAQGILGTMYLTGEGAPRNYVHAYAWCSLAERGKALLHSDPAACREAAEEELNGDELWDARDLAVAIHNGEY